MTFLISLKQYSFGEVLKHTFFSQNPAITKVLAVDRDVDRDVKPRNMNFAKVEEGGGLLGRVHLYR